MKHVDGWHFIRSDMALGYEDGRIAKPGEVISVDGPTKLYRSGLHASKKIMHALGYAPGPVICRVRLSGDMKFDQDKMVGLNREILWYVSEEESEQILWSFARKCALDVVHLWDCPDIVLRYLKTGDPQIRNAARDAAKRTEGDTAWNAAKDAAIDAAKNAARVTSWSWAWGDAWGAACDAACDAARGTAWIATWNAERDTWASQPDVATWEGAWESQNNRLTAMVSCCNRITKKQS